MDDDVAWAMSLANIDGLIARRQLLSSLLILPLMAVSRKSPGDFAMSDAANKRPPSLAYWHVWTDDEGVSHQTRCELTNFEQESMGGDAAPQWNNRLLQTDAKVIFAELPVGWVGEWHENPQPQWIIPLSGTWFVKTMDGMRVQMGPGEVSFGADQNTQPNSDGHQGHLSGTVGNEPARLMIVQLEGDRWLGLRPGDLEQA